MVHAWVEHIRQYAKEHNLTYPNAMRDPNCKATYKSKQGSDSKPVVEGGMMNIEKTSSIAKGSKEAKDYMAALRAKRKKNS